MWWPLMQSAITDTDKNAMIIKVFETIKIKWDIIQVSGNVLKRSLD
jgi:hypothetical protein